MLAGLLSAIAIALVILGSRVSLQVNSDFILPKDTKTLVMGTSRSECAFNDALISHTVNSAHSGEAYFYTYLKLKEILKDNPQVESVLLEFSLFQISDRMDDKIWGDRYLNWRYPQYASFMGLKELEILLKNNIKGFVIIQSQSAKHNFFNVFKRGNALDHFEWGGYLHLERNKTDSLLQELAKNPLELPEYNVSLINVTYLKKIQQLCAENDVKFFLIRTPIHPKFPELSSDALWGEKLDPTLKDVEFLDFKDYPLEVHEYGDLEHLNFKGAKNFSFSFDQLLKQGLLQKANKQGFIDSYLRTKRTEVPLIE